MKGAAQPVTMEPIGVVRRVSEAESAIELDPRHAEGLAGLAAGDHLEVLYWMHELDPAERRRMRVHPRGDRRRPKKGVFALRSPMRPNPIGATVAELVGVAGARLTVRGLDALDGSPVLDVKSAPARSDAGRLIDLWGRMHSAIVGALTSRLGEEGVAEALRGPVRAAGREAAGEPLADAPAIGRAIMAVERLWGIAGRVVHDEPDRFVREVSHCPWSWFAPLGCEVFAWWMEGFVAGSNPAYVYSLEKLIPRGDDVCVWSVRR